MIAPPTKLPLDYRALARRLVELLTDEEVADVRRCVLGLHADANTTEEERNAAVRAELTEILESAADAL